MHTLWLYTSEHITGSILQHILVEFVISIGWATDPSIMCKSHCTITPTRVIKCKADWLYHVQFTVIPTRIESANVQLSTVCSVYCCAFQMITLQSDTTINESLFCREKTDLVVWCYRVVYCNVHLTHLP